MRTLQQEKPTEERRDRKDELNGEREREKEGEHEMLKIPTKGEETERETEEG